MAGIPELKKKRFFEKNWFEESLGAIGATVTGATSLGLAIPTLYYSADKTNGEVTLAVIAVVGVAVLLTTAVVKFLKGLGKDRVEADEQRMDGLYAALHVLHSLVRHRRKFPRNELDRLRVTLFRVVEPGRRELEQMFNYVGGNGRGVGRRFSIHTGVIGAAVRERDTFAVSRKNDDHKSFIKEMVREWGYTEEDAKQLSIDRNSWMAIPIYYRGKEVTGVVFLDSSDKGIFTEDLRDAIEWTCAGLAVFIDERY
jgi:hypothetical protein